MRKLFALALVVAFLVPVTGLAESNEPTASFYVTPSVGSVGTVFVADASDSYDQRGFSNGLQYRWNTDYNAGGPFSAWSATPRTSFSYTSVGDKVIALEVKDSDNLTDRTIKTIKVNSGSAVTSWFTVTPTQGTTTTEFSFLSSFSLPAGDTTGYKVRWDFNGDGTFDTDLSSNKIAYHTYPSTGYFRPRLEVTTPAGTTFTVVGDDREDEDDAAFIFVTFNESPQASMQVSPASGSTQSIFYFDGSRSFDSKDLRALEYRWDYEGNGSFEVPWGTTKSTQFQYTVPGTYEATLQVRDTDGNIDSVSTTIVVRSDRLPPQASFTVISDSGLSDPRIGTPNTTFTFNAGASTDEDDLAGALQARWDFDGDGVWDTNFSTEKRAEHRYSDPGNYTVRLQIADTNGQRDTAEESLTVVANEAPIPAFTASPRQGTLGTKFTFDATASSDSQYKSTQLEVRWDFDGDGTYDTPFSTDKTMIHFFERSGVFSVKMQVRDPEGGLSMMTQKVTVGVSTPPVARLTVSPSSGTFDTVFFLDASGSTDEENAPSELYYRWDFNYTGENDIVYDTAWSRTVQRSQRFTTTGASTVRVEVKDEDGDVTVAFVTVNLHWASSYLELLKSRGILRGYAGGDLGPDRSVTRAELLKMAMEAKEVDRTGYKYRAIFGDVSATDWHASYIEKAYELSMVSGYSDRTFRPNAAVNRGEALKIILTVFGVELSPYQGTFSDVSGNDWFATYVATAYRAGLVNGYEDGLFRPGNLMTRGEAAKIIALALQGAL